jgi:anaerobic selenocysteine-containing dehydrogenase
MTLMSSQALKVNPGDAAKLAVVAGDEVTVSSPQGSIAVKVVLSEEMPPGVVFLADHFTDPMANTLTLNSNLCRVNIQKG